MMPAVEPIPAALPDRPGPPLGAILAATLGYLAAAVAATWPVARTFGSRLAGGATDPMIALWMARWARRCLAEGRSPFFSPDLYYPVGLPLGFNAATPLQTALYGLIEPLLGGDAAAYNAIWFFGLVTTGLGSWWLARRVVGGGLAAWLGGLGVMLCGPMLLHAHGHIELIQSGATPLFLLAWTGFVDHPGPGRLAAAVGWYLAMASGSSYFAILITVPAAWYVAWAWWSSGRGSRRRWARARVGWLGGFVAAALPGLLLIFANQVWATTHGYAMTRSRFEFDWYGAPAWGYVTPTASHALGRWLAPDAYIAAGFGTRLVECGSYLGVLPVVLAAYAAARRLRFDSAGYWWSCLAAMAVLSLGSHAEIGGRTFSLPAGWLWKAFPPMHLLRVPARFNLFVALFLAMPATAALRDLLGRVAWRPGRWAVGSAVAAAVLADLAMVPFPTAAIPPLPRFYAEIARSDPAATILDAPLFDGNEGQGASSLWTYWQGLHRLRTTAGYSGHANRTFDDWIASPSPFAARRLADPAYLADPSRESFGPVRGMAFRDYAWLYLTAHRLDYVVIHDSGEWPAAVDASRVKAALAEARVREGDGLAAYDRRKLPEPGRPTLAATSGWQPSRAPRQEPIFGVGREAHLALYIPPGSGPIRLAIAAIAFRRDRAVALREGDHELSRWDVSAQAPANYETTPLTLGPGIHYLTLASDGEDRPVGHREALDEARLPVSLRVASIRIGP